MAPGAKMTKEQFNRWAKDYKSRLYQKDREFLDLCLQDAIEANAGDLYEAWFEATDIFENSKLEDCKF